MFLQCTLCGKGSLSKKVFETYDMETKELFSFFECSFCKVKRIYPIPSDMSLYYMKDTGISMRKKTNRVHRFFKKVLLNKEFTRITKALDVEEFLDVGCGTGDFSELIHSKGYKIIAVDSALERPVFIENTDIPYHRIDYDTYTINDFKARRTVVILRHVLDHIKDPNNFIEKMLDYGALGFYIVVPDTDCMKMRIFRSYNCYIDPPRHIWHFNKGSLKIFFDRLNLKIVEFGYDTIPTIVPSIYRFLRIKGMPKIIYKYFEPKGTIATLSLPIDFLLPNDVLWFIVKRK